MFVCIFAISRFLNAFLYDFNLYYLCTQMQAVNSILNFYDL